MKKILTSALVAIAMMFVTAISSPDTKSDVSDIAKIGLGLSYDDMVAIPADGVAIAHEITAVDSLFASQSPHFVNDTNVIADDCDDDAGKEKMDALTTENYFNLKRSLDKEVHDTRYLERFSKRQRQSANPSIRHC